MLSNCFYRPFGALHKRLETTWLFDDRSPPVNSSLSSSWRATSCRSRALSRDHSDLRGHSVMKSLWPCNKTKS